jgi:large subunit ribosomal protein L30
MPRKKEQKPKQLKVTLVRSTISQKPAIRKTVEAMGLKKRNNSVVLPDNEAVRGMVFTVKHLVTVEEI